ncbi:relaxase/mobilization nuclease domain-containing protein [Novosphingobium album (ex Liu et al. 2023)]|uniref:relaxase/mobilization nuclease domain-containing protein n=1 Tax=Novosphingobium album (ex Liu et al. 2023) TaxID=3031130 RepID=UPI003D172C1C
MILKASTRGNAMALGRHLLNEHDNEHIEQHEVRGFMANNVVDALHEHEAVAKGVRSRQTLFSVSLSPPPDQQVDIATFEKVIAEIERRNGLQDQPRIVIFHEKEARRHAHAVWSRIDAETMTCIQHPFFKQRLQEISRETYLEQGWKLPSGLIDKRERDPRNFDLALYQQAKRAGLDPKQVKLAAQEAWAISDDARSLQQALEARGLYLARGDSRPYAAMTWGGEVLSLPKLLNRKTREIRERLGEGEALRSLDDTRAYVAEQIAPKLQGLIQEAERQRDDRLKPLDAERLAMKAGHAEERRRLDEGLAERQRREDAQRAELQRTGLAGLLDRVTGRRRQEREQAERRAWEALQRDREQRQRLIDAQLAERRQLQLRIVQERKAHHERVAELHRDLAQQLQADRSPRKSERALWLEEQQRNAERERQEWLQAQAQSREQERERWLAEQKSHTRYIEPQPPEDRLQILREQRGLTPQFNARSASRPDRQANASPDRRPPTPDQGPGIEP